MSASSRVYANGLSIQSQTCRNFLFFLSSVALCLSVIQPRQLTNSSSSSTVAVLLDLYFSFLRYKEQKKTRLRKSFLNDFVPWILLQPRYSGRVSKVFCCFSLARLCFALKFSTFLFLFKKGHAMEIRKRRGALCCFKGFAQLWHIFDTDRGETCVNTARP